MPYTTQPRRSKRGNVDPAFYRQTWLLWSLRNPALRIALHRAWGFPAIHERAPHHPFIAWEILE